MHKKNKTQIQASPTLNKEIRTSRGQLSESEEIVADLLAAVDHFFDKPVLEDADLFLIRNIREVRDGILKLYAVDVDIQYHCIYKHVLLACKKTSELIQAKVNSLDTEEVLTNEEVQNLMNLYKLLKDQLNLVRAFYLKVDLNVVEDPLCPRCQEDYLNNKK